MQMNSRTIFDAVICGAGPAGSTAAILLARAGWAVALVEKQRFPRRKVCGECVAASNLPLLDALGIGAEFAALAGPVLRQVTLYRGASGVTAALPAADHAQHPWGRALGREALDTLLIQQARALGVAVLQPWSVHAITGVPGDWRCDVRGMASSVALRLRAAIVIDAHGSWEAPPAGMPQRAAPRSAADLFAFKANFNSAAHATGVISVLALDGGYGGMVVADGGVTTVACCVRRDRLNTLRRAASGMRAGNAVQAWLQRENAGVRRALRSAMRDGPWLACGPIQPGQRITADDGVFRIGNAAGEAHPILGEGMSMALQSAALLCSHLLGSKALISAGDDSVHAALHRRYAQDWQRDFAPRLHLAAAFAHAAMRPLSAALLMSVARTWPGLLTQGARWGGKVRAVTSTTLETAAAGTL